MTATASTNWLTVVGLIYCIYGAVLLAEALLAGGRSEQSDLERRRRARGYQQIAIPLAVTVLSLGFGAQMLAQFITVSALTPIALALLALAFVLLFHGLATDLFGAGFNVTAETTADRPHSDTVTWLETELTDTAQPAAKLRAAS
jgi:hypothetical protein